VFCKAEPVVARLFVADLAKSAKICVVCFFPKTNKPIYYLTVFNGSTIKRALQQPKRSQSEPSSRDTWRKMTLIFALICAFQNEHRLLHKAPSSRMIERLLSAQDRHHATDVACLDRKQSHKICSRFCSEFIFLTHSRTYDIA
jgi:hypothetical protein